MQNLLVVALFLGTFVPESEGREPRLFAGEPASELSQNIWVVFQSRNDVYWFGSDGQGLYRYDGKTLVRFTTKDGLCGDRIREIKEDAKGMLFIGTLDGISKFDGKNFETLKPIEAAAPQGWRLDPNDLWFKGDSMDRGPYRYDGKTLHHLRLPKSPREEDFFRANPRSGPNPYGVYTIYNDSRGSLWFGTAALGLCRYDGKSFGWMYERELTETPAGGSFGIRSIMEDSEGRFWICNTGQRFLISPETGELRYRKEPGVPLPKVPGVIAPVYFNSITADTRGDLWMCTYGGGVWRFREGRLTHFPVKMGGKHVLGVSLYKDNQGAIWLGSQGSGAYRFDGESFRPFQP